MQKNDFIKILNNVNVDDDAINSRLFIWGIGNTSQLNSEGLSRLEIENIYIEGYIDSYSYGHTFNGKRVYNLDDIKIKDDVYVLVCVGTRGAYDEIASKLRNANIKFCFFDEFVIYLHKEQIIKVYDLLEDEQSKEVYAHIFECRINRQFFPNMKFVSDKEQYFGIPQFTLKDVNEVYIDCGAYVGDTIEKYIWNRLGCFKKIIAFEPNRANFDRLQNRIARLKMEWNILDEAIETYCVGIGNCNSEGSLEFYDANHEAGTKFVAVESGNCDTRIVSIDNVVQEKYTFLKADIEGYEYKMLVGATESIKQYQPKLAICLYHSVMDMYEIPLLLKNILPEYQFIIRHHSYSMDETILYAYI